MSKPGVTNFVHALIAVLTGNLVYSLLIPYLPLNVRRAPFEDSLGLAIDFWFCLVVFGIVKMVAARRGQPRSTNHQ